MEDAKEAYKKLIPEIKFDEPLKNHSTFRIGGPADLFYELKKSEDLPKIIEFCTKENLPTIILGGGSNVLFDDKGFRGIVIKIATENIEFNREKNTVKADAGVPISKLIKASMEEGFSGLEKWIGLPGTVGGAVRGNAGCNGLETKDILISTKVIDLTDLKTKELKNEEMKFAYRTSKIKENENMIVLNATFQLKNKKIQPEEQKRLMMEAAKTRGEKQPYGLTAGSFFKNPSPEMPAGRLIEEVGLKGETIGGAMISEKHGNFFINKNNATAKDILKLASLAKRQVKAKFGVGLKEEVQIFAEKNGKTLAEK